MTTEIKICGLSTIEAIDAVIGDGAHYVGFIFFEKSPRHISLETAHQLSSHIDGRINKVAVTVNADDAFLDQMVEALEPDMLQLHGSETPQRVSEIKVNYGLPVMKAFAISTLDDLQKSKPYIGIVDRFLFDAKAPKGSNLPGGNGVSFDWNLLKQFGDPKDYMLSGGLDEANVTEALRVSGASAIDISSGVESSPGVKDIAKITSFIKTIKQYDEAKLA